MDDAKAAPVTTEPPATDAETGIALEGEYPHNHRLRAEALAKSGRTKDPQGIITPETIADAKTRVARLDKAEKDANAAEAEEARATEKEAGKPVDSADGKGA